MTENQPTGEKDFASIPLKPANPTPPDGNPGEVKDYYSKTTGGPELFSKFLDIDSDNNLHKAKSYLSNPSTKNFVVDFGSDDAYCAPDLEEDDLVALLKVEVCRVPFVFFCLFE